MKLSKDYTVDELLRSSRFPALVPLVGDLPWQHVAMLSRLCHETLQPIRSKLMVPVYVLSGYRNPALNRAVRGSQYSRHQVDVRKHLFAAADIQAKDIPAETVFNMLAVEGVSVRWDRVCLYPGRGFIHIDIKDWKLGPPAEKFYVDTGTGWRELSRHDAARASW